MVAKRHCRRAACTRLALAAISPRRQRHLIRLCRRPAGAMVAKRHCRRAACTRLALAASSRHPPPTSKLNAHHLVGFAARNALHRRRCALAIRALPSSVREPAIARRGIGSAAFPAPPPGRSVGGDRACEPEQRSVVSTRVRVSEIGVGNRMGRVGDEPPKSEPKFLVLGTALA
jgi:hypothetical protein